MGAINFMLRNLFQAYGFTGEKTMNDPNLLLIAISVFSLLVIGLILSAIEFKRLEEEQADEKNIHEIKVQTSSED